MHTEEGLSKSIAPGKSTNLQEDVRIQEYFNRTNKKTIKKKKYTWLTEKVGRILEELGVMGKRVEVENIILCEVIQTQKNMHCRSLA